MEIKTDGAESQAQVHHFSANYRAKEVLEGIVAPSSNPRLKRMGIEDRIRELREEATQEDDTVAKGALTRLQAMGVIDNLFEGTVKLIPKPRAKEYIEKIEAEREK